MGSSPLARGLPSHPFTVPPKSGIIPARAGFTVRLRPVSGWRRDHPRSRGVYSSASALCLAIRGSSPLARGLPQGVPTPESPSPDHPRSRGVYEYRDVQLHRQPGSSPLARGLQGDVPLLRIPARIIPARAGFTSTPTYPSGMATDHPRSRGVYGGVYPGTRFRVGSSPLARGLQRGPGPLCGVRGIIPARAGFTQPRHSRSTRGPDHPRSRGVYAPDEDADRSGCGSSPLARGLRHVCHRPADGLRIIPARAGFTRSGPTSASGSQDHPRSRGVYHGAGARRGTRGGSSPLARGLRAFCTPTRTASGIIPARAGFTHAGKTRVEFREDHPRSRGVYTQMTQYNANQQGSSPLARGLRGKGRVAHHGVRIIPARAGFTETEVGHRGAHWDHPRSRGVYYLTPTEKRSLAGSSPLARGLRLRGLPHPLPRWIIPARAGFTLADPWNPNEPVLYQTPAAFTADPGPAPPSCGSAVVVPRWTTTPSGA